MKKLIMMCAGILFSLLIVAQPPHIQSISQSDQDMLVHLIDLIEDPANTMISMPWASTPRLDAITVNERQVTNLLSYENLWLALNEHCIQDKKQNTILEVILNKKGKVIELKQNGNPITPKLKTAFKTQKFKGLTAQAGKVIKVIVKIG